MTKLVRVVFLFSFALFWGGLTAYTGFVVRIIHDVVADPMDGGLITQRVTALLQVLGAATVGLMLWNALQIIRVRRTYGVALVLCAMVVGVAIAGLFVVHGQLDAVIDVAASEIANRDVFTASHRRYNQLTTIEWVATVLYLPITVAAWGSVDQTDRTRQTDKHSVSSEALT